MGAGGAGLGAGRVRVRVLPVGAAGSLTRSPLPLHRADIALIGLAVMGQNLILNMNDHGFVVSRRQPGRAALLSPCGSPLGAGFSFSLLPRLCFDPFPAKIIPWCMTYASARLFAEACSRLVP